MDAAFGLFGVIMGLFFFVLPIFLLVRSHNLNKKADCGMGTRPDHSRRNEGRNEGRLEVYEKNGRIS